MQVIMMTRNWNAHIVARSILERFSQKTGRNGERPTLGIHQVLKLYRSARSFMKEQKLLWPDRHCDGCRHPIFHAPEYPSALGSKAPLMYADEEDDVAQKHSREYLIS